MKPLFPSLAAAAAVVAAAVAPSASAAVIGATVADASTGNYALTSVSVTRGPAGTFTYVPGQLTHIELTDVGATGSPLLVPGGAGVPAPGSRATLLEDGRLDTGVINPVSTAAAFDFSFEVTFLTPVVNSDGEDVLVFEIGGNDTTRFYADGDSAASADLPPASFSGALLSGVPFTLYAYSDPGGGSNIDSLAELETATTFAVDAGGSGTGNVHAAGLDLSAFGVPAGGTVSSLRFQSVGTARIDPVLIVGLPAVPEPAAAASTALAAAATLLRRSRRLQ